MKVSLKELQSGVVSHIDFDYTIDLSKEEVNFERPFEKPVRIFGCISDMAGVLNLNAEIDADASGHCARCGKEISYNKHVFSKKTNINLKKEKNNERNYRKFLHWLWCM